MKIDGEQNCPRTEAAFDLLAKKWTGLIVLELRTRELRFAELKSAIPELSARLLALRTRELESVGILERLISSKGPVRVSYSLTEKGRELAGIMEEIALWAKKY
jgi:DNA-binding HxlR family transcriptional regulator